MSIEIQTKSINFTADDLEKLQSLGDELDALQFAANDAENVEPTPRNAANGTLIRMVRSNFRAFTEELCHRMMGK